MGRNLISAFAAVSMKRAVSGNRCRSVVLFISYKTQYSFIINPFTAQACTISGLKDAQMRLQSFFFGNTSTFSAVRVDENLFTCQCEKEDKKAEGFQMSHFDWSFSNDIMAAKWFIDCGNCMVCRNETLH